MRFKERIIVLIFFIFIAGIFFYKCILQGYVPFPGDLLISEYNPWKTYSYLGYVPGSYPSKVQYFDVLRQLYPWKTLSVQLIKENQIPLWNPYNFSGSPLLANIQSAVFYPLNIFYLLFAQVDAWTFLIILQPILACFFTYLFVRRIGVGKIASLFASVAFSYALFMSVFLQYNSIIHALVWLPLALYAVEGFIIKRNFLNTILLIVSLVASYFAGHLQVSVLITIVIFIFGIWRIYETTNTFKGKIKRATIFFMFLVIIIGITSIQLIPSLELIGLSARVPQNYQFLVEKLLIQPYQLIGFLVPDIFGNPATRNYLLPDTYPTKALYIGLIPFIAAIFAFYKWYKNSYIKFFSIITFLLLLLLVRSPVSEFFYSLNIPLFSTSSPSNMIFLLSLCIAVLSGFGLDIWLNNRKKQFFIIPCIIAVITAGFFVVSKIMQLPISFNNFVFSGALLTGTFVLMLFSYFISRYKKKVIMFLFIFVTVFDLFYFFHKFNPFVPKDLVFPKNAVFDWLKTNAGINRVWGYGSAALEANTETQFSLFSPNGYDPLYPKQYGEFIQSSKEGKLVRVFTNQTRSDAVVVPGSGELDLSSNMFRLRVLDILGVKYILDKAENASTEKTFPSDRFLLAHKENNWSIFENKYAVPRYFLTSDYKHYKSNAEFEKIFFSKDFNPAKTILLEKPLDQNNKLNTDQQENLGDIKMSLYSPNKIIFNTKTNSNLLFFLSDTYYPGWKAYIDNKETNIYKANYTFRAIFLPSGSHTIVFNYQPQSFSLGVKTSIISVIIALVFIAILNKKHIWNEN